MREASAVVALWMIQSLALSRAEITALGFSVAAFALTLVIGVAMMVGLSRASTDARSANATAKGLEARTQALEARAKTG